MTFIRPVRVGDVLEVFTEVESIGRTSMKIHIEAWARRFETHAQEKVTDATFTFVAIDAAGKPRPIPKEGASVMATPARATIRSRARRRRRAPSAPPGSPGCCRPRCAFSTLGNSEMTMRSFSPAS